MLDANAEVLERWNKAMKDYGDPMWDDVVAGLIRSSCAFVAGNLLSGPPEEPYNGRFLIEPHHLEWDRIVTTHLRFCIEAPRNHGKSFFFTMALPIWKAMCIPKGLGYIFSQTADQAQRILDDLKREIEFNEKLQYLYPTGPDRRWSATQIELSNGHRIVARGFGSRVRGGHPHWIMNDDVVGDDAGFSESVRNKQREFFYSAIRNMVLPKVGQVGTVGTPQHANDLYGELEKNRQYFFMRFPCLLESDTKALWPDRFSVPELKEIESEIGTVRFAREYRCVPVADDMSLFPKSLFRGEPMEQHTLTLGLPLSFWQRLNVRMYMGVDFAMSSNVKADYTVIWIMAKDKEGNRWIVDIMRERGMPYQDQLSAIATMGKRYEPVLCYLESNQMQRIFSDELRRKTDLPIKEHQTGTEKHALDIGVPSLKILLENGKFRIPRGDKRSVEETDIWINEMHNFTFVKGKVQSVGGHDDTVMGCWLCELAVRAGGFSFSFGEDIEPMDLSEDLLQPDGGQVIPFAPAPKVAQNGQGSHNARGPAWSLPDVWRR